LKLPLKNWSESYSRKKANRSKTPEFKVDQVALVGNVSLVKLWPKEVSCLKVGTLAMWVTWQPTDEKENLTFDKSFFS